MMLSGPRGRYCKDQTANNAITLRNMHSLNKTSVINLWKKRERSFAQFLCAALIVSARDDQHCHVFKIYCCCLVDEFARLWHPSENDAH